MFILLGNEYEGLLISKKLKKKNNKYLILINKKIFN